MCGIAGAFDLGGGEAQGELSCRVVRMMETIRHRGPDGDGIWASGGSPGCVLGHRRLAIVELSNKGHQPMVDHSGRYALTFNGEIYNHVLLRKELEEKGAIFCGGSDTEVLVEAIRLYGIRRALDKVVGMFAFAVYDRECRKLILCRDRLGEKPIYYFIRDDVVYFASELKALLATGRLPFAVCREGIAEYLGRGYLSGESSILEGVVRVLPGQIVDVNMSGCVTSSLYWEMSRAYDAGVNEPFRGSFDEAIDGLESHLMRAVHGQMEADVPLGAFLSGGVDSALVVSLMQRQSTTRIKTFTIGFDEQLSDESAAAAAYAKHLGTDHTEFRLSAKEALDVIPKIPYILDEPMADSSIIPTYCVSRMAKQYVTVSLSADGGDEFFAGYNNYRIASRAWAACRILPGWSRRTCAQPLIDLLSKYSVSPGQNIHRTLRLLKLLSSSSSSQLFSSLTRIWPDEILLNHDNSKGSGGMEGSNSALDVIAGFQFYDSVKYLPGDILTKVDRASMSVSLESRAPLLDHRLIEFAWTLPKAIRLHKGVLKAPMRAVLYKHIPKKLVDRPKKGFSVPLSAWLRCELRDWFEDALHSNALDELGIDRRVAKRFWNEHLSGVRDHKAQLWALGSLINWYQCWSDRTVSKE